jgi:hypothetical protein
MGGNQSPIFFQPYCGFAVVVVVVVDVSVIKFSRVGTKKKMPTPLNFTELKWTC